VCKFLVTGVGGRRNGGLGLGRPVPLRLARGVWWGCTALRGRKGRVSDRDQQALNIPLKPLNTECRHTLNVWEATDVERASLPLCAATARIATSATTACAPAGALQCPWADFKHVQSMRIEMQWAPRCAVDHMSRAARGTLGRRRDKRSTPGGELTFAWALPSLTRRCPCPGARWRGRECGHAPA
jgi:hypothetical protein